MSSTLFSRPALEFGVYSQGVTPVTIPNTVVKTLNAYGTAEVTRWESRSMPNSIAGWGNSTLCRGGETGRHAGFKIQWGRPRAGSIPALGTSLHFPYPSLIILKSPKSLVVTGQKVRIAFRNHPSQSTIIRLQPKNLLAKLLAKFIYLRLCRANDYILRVLKPATDNASST